MRSHWRVRKYHTAQILLFPCLRHGPFQARSLSLQGWRLIDLPLHTAFHQPTHWHAETCHLPRRGLSNPLYLPLRERPRLPFTARIERAPFTVRVLRARRAPGRSLLTLRRPRVARAQKIIRLHPLPAMMPVGLRLALSGKTILLFVLGV